MLSGRLIKLQYKIYKLFPQYCLFCTRKSQFDNFSLCRECYANLPWVQNTCYGCGLCLDDKYSSVWCARCFSEPKIFASIDAMFFYGYPIKQLLWQLKFIGNLALINFFAEIALNTYNFAVDAITAIPLHKCRYRTRGFNQAASLGVYLANKLQVPYFDCLTRVKNTPAQRQLSAKQRQYNLQQAFVCIKKVPYANILLVDDVVTTTSTISLASKAILLKNPDVCIKVFVIARAV